LDELVHQRTRLGILTVLSEVTDADFVFLRDTLELTDGNLSRHLMVLEDAGYVRITKTFRARRQHTAVKATRSGRAALSRYLIDLQAIIDRAHQPDPATKAAR
ncbi:MAG: transcriptional regulator, partial [Caldilineaceae bacterium]|nr:transcriptional regulator [Caldilineaceae bacterium]